MSTSVSTFTFASQGTPVGRVLARLQHGDGDAQPPGRTRVVVTAVVVLALILLPYVIGAFYVGIATMMLVFAVWTLGLNVLAGSTGLVSLGHAGMLGVSAYTVAIAQGTWGLGFWVAALLAVLVTVVVSFVFSLMITRATDITFLMITLAQGMLIWGLAHRWTSVTGGDNGLRGTSRPEWLEPYWAYYWFVLLVALVVVVTLRWFLTSSVGLRLRGTRDSPSRMRSLGYSVALQRIISFTVAGFVASVAGVLHAGYFQFISPSTVFFRQSVEGVLMILVGGIGSFLGPVAGAAGIIGARTGLTQVTERWVTVMGLLLILTVLYAPRGLVGHGPEVIDRLRSLTAWRPRGATSRAGEAEAASADEHDTASERMGAAPRVG